MRLLFIGGTGNISRDCSRLAVERGHELFLLNRGKSAGVEGARPLVADAADEEGTRRALAGLRFDAVVDFIAYRREEVERDIRLFSGTASQYVFISSASAYRKPATGQVISEGTPLANPFWDYARDKMACEEALREAWAERGFPSTIVRPSHTYSDGSLPFALGSRDFTIAQRILDGRPIVVPGDGQALWTVSHAKDFARGLLGLLGNPAAIGEAFTVAPGEALTWEAIHRGIAAALGAVPMVVHMPTDFIAAVDPDFGQRLRGDKMWSSVFDCSKLYRLVPDARARVPFMEGVRRSVDWLMADGTRRKIDADRDRRIDALLAAWERGMAAALGSENR